VVPVVVGLVQFFVVAVFRFADPVEIGAENIAEDGRVSDVLGRTFLKFQEDVFIDWDGRCGANAVGDASHGKGMKVELGWWSICRVPTFPEYGICGGELICSEDKKQGSDHTGESIDGCE